MRRSGAGYIFAPAATQSLSSLICASVRHMRSPGPSSGTRAIISVPPPAFLQRILPGPATAFTRLDQGSLRGAQCSLAVALGSAKT